MSDDEAMRALVSRQWAKDWDSPEDAVYDEPDTDEHGNAHVPGTPVCPRCSHLAGYAVPHD